VQKLLDAAKGRPDEHLIKLGLLKSLKRAAYAAEGLGHYGLAKGDYCHFTSPIRRYADLIVHRSLQPLLDNAPKKPDKVANQGELVEFARHISDTERTSADAENETKQIKMMEYLARCAAEKEPVIFEGVITDVRMMGLLVEASDIGARGVVKREDLPRGDWRFEQSQMRYINRAGQQFQLSQKVKLVVARIDMERKFVDFRIAGEPVNSADVPALPPMRQSRGRKPDQERSPFPPTKKFRSGAPKAEKTKRRRR
jgi:ribonuclease R